MIPLFICASHRNTQTSTERESLFIFPTKIIIEDKVLRVSDMSIELEPTGKGQERSNALLATTRCFSCCFGSRRSWWERVRTTSWSQSQPHPTEDRWWSRGLIALKKLREWSEIVAGPRWKTFIRRFNRNRSGGCKRVAKFQYDPLSYALNFDEGPGQNGDFQEDGFDGFRNFSTRYAAASVSTEAGKDVAVLV